MDTELLKIFDQDGNVNGTETREEVHKKGLWHETFHCWFISKEKDKYYIYFQLRSPDKKDYPNLLDITAAGHLLAHETTADGVREVEEELGISVTLENLQYLGILKYEVINGALIDREIAHTYVFNFEGTFDDFQLQKEEVAGMYKAELASFYELYLGEREQLQIKGFELTNDNMTTVEKVVTKSSFVPHEDAFYKEVIMLIQDKIVVEKYNKD